MPLPQATSVDHYVSATHKISIENRKFSQVTTIIPAFQNRGSVFWLCEVEIGDCETCLEKEKKLRVLIFRFLIRMSEQLETRLAGLFSGLAGFDSHFFCNRSYEGNLVSN